MSCVVVKIGTESVIGNIAKIAKDIHNAKEIGVNVVLVSSGAVGTGRKYIKFDEENKIRKQILAGVGQARLMLEYIDEFKKHDLILVQILLSKKNFIGKMKENLKNLLKEIAKNPNIIAIINENDTVIPSDMLFIDNDELSSYVAKLINAKKLIILTNVDGVYDDFHAKNRQIIKTITLKSKLHISQDKSATGRGGMFNKVKIGMKMLKCKIQTTIVNIQEKDVIVKCIKNEDIGTRFV